MRTITQTLNMAPGGVPPVIHVSQYDSDFTITFTLFSLFGGFTIESGTTAQIRGTKSSGTGYSADAAINISAKTVTVTGDAQMTAAAGQNIFEIVLKKNNKEISSKNFILLCERAALDADTITDESVLKELNAIIEGAETATQAAEEAEDAADRAEAAAQSLVIDQIPTQGSAHAVSSGGVWETLQSAGLSEDIKSAIIGLLKNATYNKDSRESFDALYSAFDKSLSYNLKNSDFTRKTGIYFSQNAPYPYYNTQNDRTTYIKYDLPLEFGKTYRVKVLVTPEYMTTAQMMVVLYDNEFRNAYDTEQSTFNTNAHTEGNGWTGLTDDLYVGYTPSDNKVVGMFISVKQASGQTLSDDFEVLNVQIEEVKDSQSGYLYKLTDGDFLTGYGSPFAVSAAYPFYYKNAYRKTYANFDLIAETGKTYRVIANVSEKYKAVTQMAIEMYDQNLVDAFNNKTATINTKIHTNSRGYLSELTQDVYIGKTRDGDYDCVGFRVMFSVFNSQGELIALPNDFVINSVVVEEVATNKEIYTSDGILYGTLPVNTNGRKNIIFDTDWMEDVDDAVAVRILSWGVQTGKINLIGTVLDAVDNTSVSSLARFLNYEGLGDVEIGADKQAERTNSTPAKDYHALINNNWSYGKYSTLTDVEDSTTFYRRLLSQTDGKVDIISVGFLNALSRLLDSGADEYSTMLGTELVAAKVGTIWVMGGKYPTDSAREFNFGLDELARQASHSFCEKCPVPVVFLGSEVGQNVYSGQTLAETTGTDDLLYKILQVYGVAETGRLSWDPMTALLAIRGSAIRAGYGEIRGTNTVDASTGINTFTPSNDGKDIYVVKHHTNAWHEYELNQILEKHGW